MLNKSILPIHENPRIRCESTKNRHDSNLHLSTRASPSRADISVNFARRSATRQLTIVDNETYLGWYRTEYGAQVEELKRSRTQEQAAAKAVDQLKTEEGIQDENNNNEE